jgi:hypothetical protein
LFKSLLEKQEPFNLSPETLDVDWYDILAVVWTLSYLALEFQLMFQGSML